MSDPDFDKHAATYDQVLGDAIPESLNEDKYFAEYKIALISTCLADRKPKRILDFGCGAGRSLPYLDAYFPDAELCGYDLSTASLEIAAARVPRAHLFSDWESLGDNFDLILAANVFHHIPPDAHLSVLKRCREILADDGKMFIFEHNPFNPATRWVFEHCQFDVGAEMIRLGRTLDLVKSAGLLCQTYGYTLFFPRQLAMLRRIEPWLRRIPLGAQYYVQIQN